MKYKVHCKYCAHIQDWVFEPDEEFTSMDDIFEYDYEYLCGGCGSPVRVKEALFIG